MDTSTVISVTGGFLKFVGEELADVKRKDLAKVDADLLKLKRDVLTEKLEEFKSSLDAAVKQEKAKAEQDLISRGLGNTTVRQSIRRAIENNAATELEKASREYNRAIEEIALLERRLEVQSGLYQTGDTVHDKVKILFLAADPKDTAKKAPKVRLDEEIREIQIRIRASEFRDSFDLVSRWAVRPLDLIQALNEVKPNIVHFSGHGSRRAELILEDQTGQAKPVSEEALTNLFKNVQDDIRLVVLNACYSESQARAISQQIECTVGMNVAIGDEAAIVFASMFYGALAFGKSVGQAFEQGRTGLMLEGIPEENTPVLLARPGIDALTVSFVNRKPINPVFPPVAWEILRSAVNNNCPINFVRYDGGLAIVVGAESFDCQFDLERAALLDHAVTALVQVGWIKQTDHEVYHVTHSGYEAARKLQGQPTPAFVQIKEQMPALIAEIKQGLESDDGKSVREFFVVSRSDELAGSEKPRFVLYEEDHENLRGKLDILENRGYLTDVTSGSAPIYRMGEEFVGLVLKHG